LGETGKIWHWIILVSLSLIWGTSYILMKKGLESFTVYQVASLRIIITSLCLLPVALRSLSLINRKNIFSILIIGFFGSGIPAFLFPLAQTRIDSSVAGMLNSLSPVFTLIIGILFYGKSTRRSQIAGIFLGLAGALGLMYSDTLTINWYGLFVILATLLYGISTNEVSIVNGVGGLKLTSLAFLVLSPFAVVILLMTDLHAPTLTENWIRNLGFIAILAIFGSALALALFYLLVKDTSPVFASMVTYYIPIVAALWGIADGEKFTTLMLLSVIVILGGVYLINRPSILKKFGKYIR